MRPEAPLEEVAAHLPQEAAAYLLECDSAVQTAVLVQVRALMVFWESQRYTFDPIAYEGVLNALVPSFAPLYAEVQRLTVNDMNLRAHLAAADALIKLFRHSIEGAP